MKFIHLSDIHLNFCSLENPNASKIRKKFIDQIYDHISLGAKFILLTGDIAEAPSLTSELFWLSENIKRPIYYLLGNHDIWFSNFDTARFYARSIEQFVPNKNLNYLTEKNPIPLEDGVWLIGVDGWYDCRNFKRNLINDFQNGSEAISDFEFIADLASVAVPEEKLQLVQNIADMQIGWLYDKIQAALRKNPKKIIIGTHVPPVNFKVPDKIENHPGFYSSRNLMEMLLTQAEQNKEIEFYVFCGHTHWGGNLELDNLKIYSKVSEYGAPDSKLIEI